MNQFHNETQGFLVKTKMWSVIGLKPKKIMRTIVSFENQIRNETKTWAANYICNEE